MEDKINELPYNKEKFEKHIQGLIDSNRKQLRRLNSALKFLNKGRVSYKIYVTGYWPEYDKDIEVEGAEYEETLNRAIEEHKRINGRSDSCFQASIHAYAVAGKVLYDIASFDGAKFLEARSNGTDISRTSGK